MSKIGKKSIAIPDGVDIKIDSGSISVKGPKGELRIIIPDSMEVLAKDGKISVQPKNKEEAVKNKNVRSVWGLTRALIQNMMFGVTSGFEENLEFQGVGYKANAKGNELEMSLGYSHPVAVKAPQGIEFKVEKNMIKISGIDKDMVGKVAAEIRSKRLPEPYKGSGIRYQGEIIKRKAGKKAVASG